MEIDNKYFRDISDKMKLPHDVQLASWQYEMLDHKANRNMNAFFALAIKHKLNICMVGGTGSGKTTFTKALSDLVPPETRIITLEDTHELDLPKHPNHAYLFYKPLSTKAQREYDQKVSPQVQQEPHISKQTGIEQDNEPTR